LFYDVTAARNSKCPSSVSKVTFPSPWSVRGEWKRENG